MRVIHLITRLIVGGAQENTIATVLGLRSKPGFEQVELIAGPTDPAWPEGSLESRVSGLPGCLSIEPGLVRQIAPMRDWATYWALYRRFLRQRPMIVHTHSGKAGILGRLAASRARVPCIIHTIHGPSFGAFQNKLSNRAFLAAERLAGAKTHHFVGVADAMCRQYLDAGIGQPSQYSTIYSGFDLDAFLNAKPCQKRRAELGLGPNDFVVGKIARLFDLKGHDQLFEILPALVKAIPQAKLLLVGGGPLADRFEARLRSMGLRDRVVFTGLVRPEAVPDLVGIMDVLVHLSFREGLPRALPQAMAAGKPVIAYALDGAPEVCRQDETGHLVQPNDVKGLLHALVSLAKNPETRRLMGSHGREWVRNRFATETMVQAIEDLYLRLVNPSSSRHGVD